jgi:transcriptional regulator with XRE-family HTH domain
MHDTAVGPLLREWRSARRLSQLDLALDVGVSARHLSCVETGKARPSREMVARLADALEMPLRERNALLLAAGYAPRYRESPLASLAPVARAIDLILRQQEPFPAFVVDRLWNIHRANAAAERVNRFVLGGAASAHANMVRQIFDPADLRRAVANWDEVARELIHHLHAVVAATPHDLEGQALLREALSYPDVPARWRHRDLDAPPSPLLTTVLRRGDHAFRFFSTITSFAMPHDVTLDELRIECCFPEDEATERMCRELAEGRVGAS